MHLIALSLKALSLSTKTITNEKISYALEDDLNSHNFNGLDTRIPVQLSVFWKEKERELKIK